MKLNKLSESKTIKSSPYQIGFGMIEVLVTLFILTIGLLGAASLQFLGAFSNANALNRTQAIIIAQQFAERLNANAIPSDHAGGFVVNNAYFSDGLYNFSNLNCSLPNASPYDCYCKTYPAAIANCQSSDCNARELAEFDAYQVSCAAVRTNPNTLLSLSCTDNDPSDTNLCSAGSLHEVIISWPVRGWQGNKHILNPACNNAVAESRDCVIVELVL